MLVEISVCLPGMVLVITTIVLDTITGPSLVRPPGTNAVLVTTPGGPTGLVGKPEVCVDDEGKEDATILDKTLVVKTAESRLSRVVVTTGDRYGREGCATGTLILEADTGGGSGEPGDDGGKMTEEGIKVTVDIITTFPEVEVLVTIVSTPDGSDIDDTGPEVLGSICVLDPGDKIEDKLGVRMGLRVAGILGRLGGAMLFSHSVVPLMTE